VSVGDDFVQYLTELGIGTPGINLWLGTAPDRAAAITVVETGGPAPYHDYGPGEVIDHPRCRSSSATRPTYSPATRRPDPGRIRRLANWPINGTRYLSVTAMSDPAYLGSRHEPGETHEFSLNFATMRERAAPVIGLCGAYYDLSKWHEP